MRRFIYIKQFFFGVELHFLTRGRRVCFVFIEVYLKFAREKIRRRFRRGRGMLSGRGKYLRNLWRGTEFLEHRVEVKSLSLNRSPNKSIRRLKLVLIDSLSLIAKHEDDIYCILFSLKHSENLSRALICVWVQRWSLSLSWSFTIAHTERNKKHDFDIT